LSITSFQPTLEVTSTQLDGNVQPVVKVAATFLLIVLLKVWPLLSLSVIVHRLLAEATRVLSRNAPPVPPEMRPVAGLLLPLLMKGFGGQTCGDGSALAQSRRR
jgi:hypothetical protein